MKLTILPIISTFFKLHYLYASKKHKKCFNYEITKSKVCKPCIFHKMKSFQLYRKQFVKVCFFALIFHNFKLETASLTAPALEQRVRLSTRGS